MASSSPTFESCSFRSLLELGTAVTFFMAFNSTLRHTSSVPGWALLRYYRVGGIGALPFSSLDLRTAVSLHIGCPLRLCTLGLEDSTHLLAYLILGIGALV